RNRRPCSLMRPGSEARGAVSGSGSWERRIGAPGPDVYTYATWRQADGSPRASRRSPSVPAGGGVKSNPHDQLGRLRLACLRPGETQVSGGIHGPWVTANAPGFPRERARDRHRVDQTLSPQSTPRRPAPPPPAPFRDLHDDGESHRPHGKWGIDIALNRW